MPGEKCGMMEVMDRIASAAIILYRRYLMQMPESYSDIFGGSYGYYNAASGVSSAMGPVLIVSFILALLLAVFFLPRRNRGRFSPVLDKVYNFLNFNVYWVTWIIKILFATMAIFLFVMGVYVMFALSFWAGLILIISILLVRVAYEIICAVLSIRDNVEEMNRRMNGGAPAPGTEDVPARPAAPRTDGGFSFRNFAQNGPQNQAQPDQAAPAYEPVPVEQIKTSEPEVPSCSNCGAELRPGAMFCANCGARVK